MIRKIWRQLQPLLPPGSRFDAGLYAMESFIAGILEAALMVVVVSIALAVVDGGDRVHVAAPGLTGHSLPANTALVFAGVCGLVVTLLHLHAARVAAKVPSGVLRTARNRAVRAFSAANWARQSADREGGLQETVSSLATQTATMVMHLGTFVAAMLGLGALMMAAVFVDPLTMIAVLAFGALLVVALRPVGALTRRRSADFVRKNSRWVEEMSEWTSLAMELRVFGVENLQADRLIDANANVAAAMTRTHFASRMGSALFRDVAIMLLVIGIGVLHWLDSANIGAIGSVVILVVRALSYAQVANFAMQTVNELSPNLEALLDRLASLEAAPQPIGETQLPRLGTIELLDLDYDYQVDRPGIRNVSLRLSLGEAVGVIGPSGGGKSTLVQVLLGLRHPTSGAITANGVPYDELDRQSWRRIATLVPQEPRLFQGTVAENIAFFRPDIERSRIEAAVRAAHLVEDVARLPDGLDSELGPRGAGLSGGQKQRLAIARALVGDPQLLVLDEPTSALDVRSEQLLKETIDGLKGRVTLVIVAHRLSTLSSCDRVVAMSDGRVQFIGSLIDAMSHVDFTHQLLGEPVDLVDTDVEWTAR